ncbi:MAG TPA: ABC transporter permease/substrate-binding protein [Candidatus Binatia bacterium]|nr:ABC transporter permease/substrate-binding protein [Candidatus Binatia bacterium]
MSALREQLALLPAYLTGHLELSLLAIAIATGASIPLGVLATRVAWLEGPVLAIAGVVQTIPGLALLAAVVPLLAALGFQSIGFLPAIIGLTLYGVLPILRNTVAGIDSVDPALKEAARGVGMTDGQQLRRVELPLAMPVIVAGIRTATVWTVGMATLSTPVGATSLGNYIFAGLQTRNYTAVLVGSVAAAALALVLDGLVHGLESGLRRRRRGMVALALASLVVLYGYTAWSLARDARGARARPIVVGAKTFTEQYVVAEVLAGWIERTTGLPTRVAPSLGSTVAFDALRNGDIDVYVDYTGTLWTTILRRQEPPASREAAIDQIGRFLASQGGMVLVAPLGFENAYALAMRDRDAEARGLRTIGDLARVSAELSMGGDYEFFERPEWRSLERAYGLRFGSRRTMDPSLLYQAVALGNVDAISAYTTDGRIAALHLRVLDDDRHAIPPYDAVILASARLAREHPDAIAALARLQGAIDARAMREANREVDEDGRTPRQVASDIVARIAGATPEPARGD